MAVVGTIRTVQLHLLDGTYELFRSHFGAQPRTAPDGREVGATAGILNSTLALLQEPGVTHLAVAFDSVIASFRNELYAGYKTESGMPEELLAQFPLAERAMAALGVTVWSMIEYEADDAIATGAHRFGDQFDQVVILSPDKDLSQCVVGNHIVAFDRRKAAFTNEDGVWDKFGVGPRSIPDYLGLVGDSADGFPGVPGWGAKSTATVLGRYGSIEAIPLERALWDVEVRGADRLLANLRANLGDALLFRYLALLRRDVPLTETADQLAWQGAHHEPWDELCEELGFGRLRDRPHHWAAL